VTSQLAKKLNSFEEARLSQLAEKLSCFEGAWLSACEKPQLL
jgi:hypothetical protein